MRNHRHISVGSSLIQKRFTIIPNYVQQYSLPTTVIPLYFMNWIVIVIYSMFIFAYIQHVAIWIFLFIQFIVLVFSAFFKRKGAIVPVLSVCLFVRLAVTLITLRKINFWKFFFFDRMIDIDLEIWISQKKFKFKMSDKIYCKKT